MEASEAKRPGQTKPEAATANYAPTCACCVRGQVKVCTYLAEQTLEKRQVYLRVLLAAKHYAVILAATSEHNSNAMRVAHVQMWMSQRLFDHATTSCDTDGLAQLRPHTREYELQHFPLHTRSLCMLEACLRKLCLEMKEVRPPVSAGDAKLISERTFFC